MPPKKPASSSRGSAVIAVLIAIAGLTAGFILAKVVAGTSGDSSAAYAKGFADARAKVIAAGLIQTPEPVYAMRGTVTKAGSGSVEVTVAQTATDPFEEPAPTSRTVTITGTTKIILVTEKDQTKFASEMEAYAATQRAEGTAGEPPSPIVDSQATASDLAVGMVVVVRSTSDIRTTPSFAASEIRIVPDGAPGALQNPISAPTPQDGAELPRPGSPIPEVPLTPPQEVRPPSAPPTPPPADGTRGTPPQL